MAQSIPCCEIEQHKWIDRPSIPQIPYCTAVKDSRFGCHQVLQVIGVLFLVVFVFISVAFSIWISLAIPLGTIPLSLHSLFSHLQSYCGETVFLIGRYKASSHTISGHCTFFADGYWIE